MSESTTKQGYALSLALRGLPVFPIKGGQKSPPLITEWPAQATCVPIRIRAWWTQWPSANIGIHCKDLIVLDVDIAKGGFDSLVELQAENEVLPPTLETRTPSGGVHLFFFYPGGVANGVNKLGSGIDIRSDQGYVVGPGSQTTGTYELVKDLPIAPAPKWLSDLCQKKPEKLRSDGGETCNQPDVDIDLAITRAADWLATREPAYEGQGGDHYTFSVICKIRDIGVPESHALEALEEWNARCEPPWQEDELTHKIHNAYRYAQNPPASESVEAMFDIVPVQETAPSITTEQDEELYTADDVTLDGVLKSEYLVKGWLEKGAQGLLFGHWGAGKTFVAIHLSAHLASGHEWFDNRIRQGGVLYLGYEGADAMKKRMYAIRKKFPDWDLSTFMVRPMRWPLVKKGSDAKTRGMEYAERALATFKARTGSYPSLLVIDPLRNALGGSDSDPDLTAPYLAYLQKLTKITGCATLTVHHPGHGDAERSRGDSGIEAHMDTVIKVDGSRGSIEAKKQRDDPKGTMFYELETITLGVDEDGDPRTTCVVKHVNQNPLDPALTNQQREVVEALQGFADGEMVTKMMYRRATNGLSTAIRAEILDVLVQKQYLVEEGKGWRLGAGAGEAFD